MKNVSYLPVESYRKVYPPLPEPAAKAPNPLVLAAWKWKGRPAGYKFATVWLALVSTAVGVVSCVYPEVAMVLGGIGLGLATGWSVIKLLSTHYDL